jgi:hypothetical protein
MGITMKTNGIEPRKAGKVRRSVLRVVAKSDDETLDGRTVELAEWIDGNVIIKSARTEVESGRSVRRVRHGVYAWS